MRASGGNADSPGSYHLEELAIARARDDPRRVMPAIPAACRRVIDIGCGMGQTLIAGELRGALACGVEPDIEALRLGRKISREIQLVCGAAEKLPVRTGWAEFAIARLSLPYTHIPETVREVYRVLEAGGHFWTVLHPLAMTLQAVQSSIVHLRWRALVFEMYTLLNGLALHVAGRQFRYPLNRTRCESFQTVFGMKRILHDAGFQTISVTRKPFFVVTARKPKHPASQ